MLVDHVVYYLIHHEGLQWRGQDYKARGIVKCVKDEHFKGNFEARLSGKVGRYDFASRAAFLNNLWPHMAGRISTVLEKQPAVIVPIPNSNAVVGSRGGYKTLTYAQEIAKHSNGKLTAVDALRWKTAQEPQHKQAGKRDPEPRYLNLQVVKVPDQPVVLFDDFFTSGSSLIAACWRLRNVDREPMRAFVIGRNTDEQKEQMTAWGSEELEVPKRVSLFEDF
jgi:hypothetical protein